MTMPTSLARGWGFMMLTRQNAKGGPKIKNYPIDVDQKTSRMGHKVGYCEGCNEPLLIPLGDIYEVLSYFHLVHNVEPKKPLRQKIGEWLLKEAN